VVVGRADPGDHRKLARHHGARGHRSASSASSSPAEIPLGPALVVALGALPAAQLGALASRRLSGDAAQAPYSSS